MPAIQIYTLTTLDALIAALVFGTVYFFTRTDTAVSIVGTVVCLFIVSFQTFMAIFVVPVLAGITLVNRKKAVPFVLVLGAVALSYGLLYVFVDFNYVHSFALASTQQHRATEGFLLLVSPFTYLITRLENVLEIALFFTPFLCLLTIRGISVLSSKREAFVLTGAALLSLFGLFLASVYHTGETARAAMYIYPFLMLPVAAALESVETSAGDRWRLAAAVFGQSLLVQLVGFYFW